VLGHYVREQKALSLMDALRKMSYLPAKRMEGFVPQMKNKGRIKVGADADLTIFDAATVIDKATFQQPTVPSVGIPYVIVAGVPVVDGGTLTEATPGKAIRAPLRQP
jgi:dihydroorotase